MIVRLDCWRLSTPQLEKTWIFLSLLWLVALFIHCVVSKGQSSNPQTQCKWWPWAVVNPKAWIHACYWYGITFEQSHFGWVPLNLAIGLKPVSGVACHHNCPTSHGSEMRATHHAYHHLGSQCCSLPCQLVDGLDKYQNTDIIIGTTWRTGHQNEVFADSISKLVAPRLFMFCETSMICGCHAVKGSSEVFSWCHSNTSFNKV